MRRSQHHPALLVVSCDLLSARVLASCPPQPYSMCSQFAGHKKDCSWTQLTWLTASDEKTILVDSVMHFEEPP